jgi:hypothetical protein
MQIVHAGVQTVLRVRKDRPMWGPSDVYDRTSQKTPKAMTQRDIKETVQAIAHAAINVSGRRRVLMGSIVWWNDGFKQERKGKARVKQDETREEDK